MSQYERLPESEIEEALRSSEQQFKLLVQSVTDYAIYMLDRQGRVANWNAGAERIKGYRPEEIIGEHFSRFYTEEDRQAGMPERGLETAAREGRFEREGWRVRKDGTRFWAHIVIDAIRDDNGQTIGFAKITRDITERRDAQRALEEAQQALFQTQKLESIGQLTGGIAHDFNNLLTAILGSLELLRKRLPDDPKSRALLDNAVHGAQRGASLTQRMLAFARRQELTPEAIDLATLVRGMTGLMERSIGPGVVIHTDFPPGLPPAVTDANQLEAALLNMVVNARDAMPAGGEISISADAASALPGDGSNLTPGRYVRLRVRDTGQGMDEQTLGRALEPFFTTKGVGKGTGLGLPMVQGLAMQSGGKLQLESRVGEGTTVEIWLPVAASHIAPARPREDPDRAEQAIAAGRLTILVVDDDDLVLMNTTSMLEDLGHAVIEASSGQQALERLSAAPAVDLVISDQVMPGMTGLQLACAIRSERPALPIILATGYAELPADADAGPILHRLSKPFRQRELAEAVAAARG
ncbi:MAG: PAS domain S-box protein [Caulobacteraceae bacterium]